MYAERQQSSNEGAKRKKAPKIGQKVQFVPGHSNLTSAPTAEEVRRKTATGVVTYVNKRHKFFCAEYSYGDQELTEALKFSDIGNAVKICGK